ncbi:hypothetical protein GC194_11875 [bacterium]|nr:hypothetical protein [bacterium]
MRTNPSEYYNSNIGKYRAALLKLAQSNRRIAALRLLAALLLVALVLAMFYQKPVYVFALAGLLLLVAFIKLVKMHLKIKAQTKLNENLLQINENEIQALSGNHGAFQAGNHFLTHDHAHAYDLDLFGKNSLYQRLCRCSVAESQAYLAQLLCQNNRLSVAENQAIIKELMLKADWRQELQANGQLHKENDGYSQLKNWFVSDYQFIGNKGFKALRYIIPSLMAFAVLLWLLGAIAGNVVVLAFIINLGLVGRHVKKVNAFHASLSRKQHLLDAYARLLNIIGKEQFVQQELQQIQTDADGGNKAINQFGKWVGLLDARLNIMIAVLLNGVLAWDIVYCLKIESWKKQYSEQMGKWISAIAAIESYNSLANYAFNHPQFCWPQQVDDDIINAQNMGHTFLSETKRVCNDFQLSAKGQVVLLSGANMSGKSTFLRTVGINLVMARQGLPVCATHFSFKPIPVFTSMRINDSLQDSESYFYAELKRLKFIIDEIKSGREIFVLLDEILRGTNSNDKHKGSAALIAQLIGLQTSAIVASHDISLSVLEEKYTGKLLNRSFEVENRAGELVFDYKLRQGVCKNLNASYLMEKMGIINNNE